MWVISAFRSIYDKSTHVSDPNTSTACATTLKNIADNLDSPPSHLSSAPNIPQNDLAHIIFELNAGQCFFPVEPLISFCGWILVEICSFLFLVTQIQCLGDHNIVEEWL